jgi:hypothetical protein
MQGNANLMQVIQAFRPVGRFAHSLHGRQEKPHQDGDDRNDDEQLDECESTTTDSPKIGTHGTPPRLSTATPQIAAQGSRTLRVGCLL